MQFAWNIIERVVQDRNRLPFAEFSEVDACRLAVDAHVQADGLGDVDLTQVELRPVGAADAQAGPFTESLVRFEHPVVVAGSSSWVERSSSNASTGTVASPSFLPAYPQRPASSIHPLASTCLRPGIIVEMNILIKYIPVRRRCSRPALRTVLSSRQAPERTANSVIQESKQLVPERLSVEAENLSPCVDGLF